MISFEEALTIVREATFPLPPVKLPVKNLLGKILAETILTSFPLPRFDNSAVDGYALRSVEYQSSSEDHPAELTVYRTIPAGGSGWASIPPRHVVRVMTGAPVPAGADAVVMREEVEGGDGLHLHRPVTPGENLRRKGEELPAGAPVLQKGCAVTPAVIGMLATLGLTTAAVYRPPRVSIVVTGDELKPAGESLSDGQIYDSNGPSLASALKAIGVDAVSMHSAPDRSDRLKQSLGLAMTKSDLVITVGGVSVGDYDLVRGVSGELGVRELFWRVAIKPGKPIFFGVAEPSPTRRVILFGLPGNPVSALITFQLFVKSAVRRMMGAPWNFPVIAAAQLDIPLCKRTDRMEFVRGWMSESDGVRRVVPVKGQESHMISGLAAANCLIIIPKNETQIHPGAEVKLIPLEWTI